MDKYLIWITGLPGSGKTTLARNLASGYLKAKGITPIVLDGDELRTAIGESRYDYETRIEVARKYQRLAQLLFSQGFIVIVATVSLFHEIQRSNREFFETYVEIFLDVPVEELSSGPRSEIFSSSDGVNPAVRAEFPERPDIRLTLDSYGSRSNWLPEVEEYLKVLLNG